MCPKFKLDADIIKAVRKAVKEKLPFSMLHTRLVISKSTCLRWYKEGSKLAGELDSQEAYEALNEKDRLLADFYFTIEHAYGEVAVLLTRKWYISATDREVDSKIYESILKKVRRNDYADNAILDDESYDDDGAGQTIRVLFDSLKSTEEEDANTDKG